MALLLDLANIVGGFLLSIGILQHLPYIGNGLRDLVQTVAPFRWVVGTVTLVISGYFVINHLVSGPRLFHFELVGTGVGLALLWDRLSRRQPPPAVTAGAASDVTTVIAGPDQGGLTSPGSGSGSAGSGTGDDGSSGPALLLAIFGLIAVVIGIQGLVTPN